MTISKVTKICEAMEKPLTPFSIADILSKPTFKQIHRIHLLSDSERPRQSINIAKQTLIAQTSPLCALQELASKTFKCLGVLQAARNKGKTL